MIKQGNMIGTRIRDRRMGLGIKQAVLANDVEISASYLNLIEHNRRSIGGKLLNRLADALRVSPQILSQGRSAALADTLDVIARDVSADVELARSGDLITRFPGWAAALSEQRHKITQLEERLGMMDDRLTHDAMLARGMDEIVAAVSAIRSTSSILMEGPKIDAEWRSRFHGNIDSESRRLADASSAMAARFERLSRRDPAWDAPLDAVLAAINRLHYHFAAIENGGSNAIEDVLASDEALRDHAAISRTVLTRYADDARLLPLPAFRRAGEEAGYDPATLAMRFDVDLPVIFRRLASLPRDASGADIGLFGCDAAGGVTFRKCPDGFDLPVNTPLCPVLPLFEALRQPGQPLRRYIVAPHGRFFRAFAIAEPQTGRSFEGPAQFTAWMLLIPTDDDANARRVGGACRTCRQDHCAARREPSILTPAEE